MKKAITIGLILLMIMSSLAVVLAEEIATPEDVIIAGETTPEDGLSYQLDLLSDNFQGMFSESKRLQNIQERISEAKVMLENNQTYEAQIALNQLNFTYNKLINQSKSNETKLFADNLGQKIALLASTKGKLTPQLRFEIKMLIAEHKLKMLNERNITRPNFTQWIDKFQVVNGTIRKK